MTADPEPDQPERTLHRIHLIAVRLAPFMLWAVSIYLILVGTVMARTDAVSISWVVVGVVACGAGAMVSRAEEIKLGKEGVEAKLTPIYKVDRTFVVAIEAGETPALVAANAASPEKAVGETLPTVVQLLAGATDAGWAVAQSGVNQVMLTKLVREARPRFAVGDTVIVSVPTEWLMAPVPATVMETVRAVGFTMPPHFRPNSAK